MSACEVLAHTGATYSAIQWHRASTVVLVVLVFILYFDLDNLIKGLLRVATFILVFCMCCL